MFRAILMSLFLVQLVAAPTARGEEPAAKIVVDLTSPGPAFPRTMHGIFFEDINYAADGGLYAELTQNRSFEHRERKYAWSPAGSESDVQLMIGEELPLNRNNPHYLRVEAQASAVGVVNSGYDGIHIEADKEYEASLYVRSKAEAPKVTVRLLGEDSQTLGETTLTGVSGEWQKLTGSIVATDSDATARLEILVEAPGT